jgi:hypothetical protein
MVELTRRSARLLCKTMHICCSDLLSTQIFAAHTWPPLSWRLLADYRFTTRRHSCRCALRHAGPGSPRSPPLGPGRCDTSRASSAYTTSSVAAHASVPGSRCRGISRLPTSRALGEIHRKFSTIEVDRQRVKPAVKIPGEFYLQTVEGDPNYNIHRWLKAEGAQISKGGDGGRVGSRRSDDTRLPVGDLLHGSASRSGRTMARRSLCRSAQAVS